MCSWYTGRWWVGCYIGTARELDGAAAVPNVTVHPSTASVPITITVLLYNGLLLCGFNVHKTTSIVALPITEHFCFWKE